MRNATLCFLINKETNEILLGMKKRGFGKDKWNGFGGKIAKGETEEDGAKRELLEESGVHAIDMEKVGELTFFFPHVENNAWDFEFLEIARSLLPLDVEFKTKKTFLHRNSPGVKHQTKEATRSI